VSWDPVEVLNHNKPEMNECLDSDQILVSEPSDHRRESFAKVYNNNEWGGEVKSGKGSKLKNAKTIMKVLDIIIKKLKKDLGKEQISLLDSSCGDMTWMPTFLGNRSDIEFTGYDIVPANIENHKKRFNATTWNFEVHDSVVDTIPKFDLILSRHTMFHIKTIDVAKLLKNFYDSGSHFLLATNNAETTTNAELIEDARGRGRYLNLHLNPFCLPPPICQADNDGEYSFHYIAFWELDSLRVS